VRTDQPTGADEVQERFVRAFRELSPRVFGYACREDEPTQTLTVHVGKHKLGHLTAANAVVFRQILDVLGSQTIEFDAAAIRDDPDSPVIWIGVPDRI
jgi:hypothetical protein